MATFLDKRDAYYPSLDKTIKVPGCAIGGQLLVKNLTIHKLAGIGNNYFRITICSWATTLANNLIVQAAGVAGSVDAIVGRIRQYLGRFTIYRL